MSDDQNGNLARRAAHEIVDLHVLLQAWFNAEGSEDLATILEHFDEGFTMITPAAALITHEQLAAGLRAGRGGRKGLVMAISEVAVRHVEAGSALVTYRERQTQAGQVTDRLSTALLLDRPDRPGPVWRHLQETMLG
jgi:hypothetical protein